MGSLVVRVITRLPAVIESALVVLRLLVKKYGWLAVILKDVISSLDKLLKLIDELKKYLETQPDQVPVDDILNGKCNCKTSLLLEKKP
jgi:hypothetical protein